MSTTTAGTLFQDWVDDIGGVFTDNLPAVLAIAAGLFGLIVIVRLAKRFIAGR